MVHTQRTRILLAELDDRIAIGLLRQLYEHNHTHDVLVARSADTTRVLLQSDRFAVIAVRAELAKAGELCELRAALPGGCDTRIAAVIDGEPGAQSGPLYAAGADGILRGSDSPEQLVGEILALSASRTLLSGRLEHMSVPDLIQSSCVSQRSLTIRIATPDKSAVVWLENGQIHHAVCGTQSGHSALAAILCADQGQFCAIVAPVPLRTIHGDWQHVLIEAARLGDEEAEWPDTPLEPTTMSSGAELPRQEVRKVSHVRRLGKTYRELNELGLQSMKAGDFAEAREYWAAAREIGEQGEAAHDTATTLPEPTAAFWDPLAG